ncbi:hypothetical protein OAO18_03480 [Francisellaceae bacterium]|nr:hypothetical protein [Francisellaceae bacterium]
MSPIRFIGCVLLVISCMIGAGVLALPVLAMQMGIMNALIIMLVFYIVMCISGLLTLEVSITMPKYRNHFGSMAELSFGSVGKYITIIAFAITLYAALTAYVAASPEVIYPTIKNNFGEIMPQNLIGLIFTLVLGAIVILSVKYAEVLNRFIMGVKLGSLILVVTLLIGYVSYIDFAMPKLIISKLPEQISVIILAFSYQSIVPSLVNYIGKEHGQSIKKIIITATTFTCIIYILWVSVMVGLINQAATNVDVHSMSLAQLVDLIHHHSGSHFAPIMIEVFLNITLFTSFLALSVAFVDFWIDALKLSSKYRGRIIAGLVAFIPPWIIATYFESVFIKALAVSGYAGLVFALLLPTLVAYKLYSKNFPNGSMYLAGGKPVRAVMAIIAIFVMVVIFLGSLFL